jgi:hypothetical protein
LKTQASSQTVSEAPNQFGLYRVEKAIPLKRSRFSCMVFFSYVFVWSVSKSISPQQLRDQFFRKILRNLFSVVSISFIFDCESSTHNSITFLVSTATLSKMEACLNKSSRLYSEVINRNFGLGLLRLVGSAQMPLRRFLYSFPLKTLSFSFLFIFLFASFFQPV